MCECCGFGCLALFLIHFRFIFLISDECTTDRCGRDPCRHGGECLPSDQGAICLCPLGYGGDLCEMRLDLQVKILYVISIYVEAPVTSTATKNVECTMNSIEWCDTVT